MLVQTTTISENVPSPLS